ncbi:MAG: DUF5025 domain-containing protein [Flavobacterium sp.]|nr:DUF5025 domain-containing protein [Flavobacterium sp.]
MKTTILIILFALTACSKDSTSSLLPPETQVGANTFGVTINGKVYIPRDPTGINVGPSGHGMKYKIDSFLPWSEIFVIDGASAVGFKMVIHFKELLPNITGIHTLKTSNFQDGLDSSLVDHIYFKIWDSNISNYAYYGSLENQGEVNIKKFDGSPNWILSGTFNGKFVRYDNPNEFITITDGRFDLNLITLQNTHFP